MGPWRSGRERERFVEQLLRLNDAGDHAPFERGRGARSADQVRTVLERSIDETRWDEEGDALVLAVVPSALGVVVGDVLLA